MGVYWKSKIGENDNIYFIDNCCIKAVIDENGVFDEENSIEFKIGDMVYFLDWFYEMVGNNQYIMIKFKDELGRVFSANELFFVTEDVWEGLRAYFKDYYSNNQ